MVNSAAGGGQGGRERGFSACVRNFGVEDADDAVDPLVCSSNNGISSNEDDT